MVTTIQLSEELKERIKEFGMKGETYSNILERLLQSARKRLLHDVLMNDEGFIPIEDAIQEAKKRWPK